MIVREGKELLTALKLSSNGHHGQAAAIYQSEANKERPVQEKELLWEQAERSRRIADS